MFAMKLIDFITHPKLNMKINLHIFEKSCVHVQNISLGVCVAFLALEEKAV